MLTPHVKSNSPVIVPSTFKLYFNTEFTSCYRAPGSCLLGPDGPWQALVLNFGSGINLLPLYPRFETYGTTVLTTGEDRYNSSISSTSRKTGLQFLDDWARYAADVRSFVNQSYPISGAMTPYFDDMQLARSLSPDPRFNSTLFAAHDWNYKTVNGSSYTPRVGLWGLRGVEGPETGDVNASNILPPGPLEQLKSNGIIGTETVSMNLASASLEQRASFILGGYDESRLLGLPGAWPLYANSHGEILLRDLRLGVEEGGSPFKNDTAVTKDAPLSIWQGLGGDEAGIRSGKAQGAAEGSARVYVDAGAPSIYLPRGNCEAAAKHLPVTWRDDIGYYTWNVDDPQYKQIVSSPAYLGFVLATPEAKNVTIKVAFALLNLTLESPIVSTPTQYFPCHSTDSASGTWLLGRAFLQAVFYGVDYEKKQRWIGQGPGPGQQQMIVKTWPTGTDAFQASPADSYASTWRKHWTVLPEGSNETSTQKPGNQTSGGSGLSGGIIAGIAVGSVALLAILAGALWWWFMRKRRNAVHTKEGGKGMSLDQRHELGIEQRERHELGPEQRHELGAEQRHEPPVQRVVHEMPGSTPDPIQVETRRPAGGGNSSEGI
ncbi:hypothetical protein BM221_000187 [Beauveria bassiana]|uniref:Peptidase A1 domain-containing protein n=1 Tax=Beauveria bassiana TaxID=176275 RepID=A0A2N6NZU9_BEABA|nr:hypothetical protein BM221_000187 [Beauveria bassiana]